MLSRRRFLGAAGLGAFATACGDDSPDPPRTSPSRTASPTPSRPPGPPDWNALAAGLDGTLVRPADGGYDTARRLYNTRFDQVRPQAVARCTTVEDVRECVTFASRYAVPLALRSGGHSYAGWSTGSGLVLDTGPLSAVRPEDGRVVLGAGARLIDVYAGVAAAGAGVPAGSCPTVGVTGLTLGGGISVLTRAWGLTCDTLDEAEVVTADGRVLTCAADREPDLYWALRGGGGGSFGVTASVTLRTQPAEPLAMEFLSWPWSRAADVVRAWQEWLPDLPDELWSNLHLLSTPSGPPGVSVNAFHLGPSDQAAALVDRLVAAVGAEPSSRSPVTRPYLEAMLQLAGCSDRTVAECHLAGQTPEGQLERETYAATSHVLAEPLGADGVAELVAGVDRLQANPDAGDGGVLLDALGGAVARVGKGDTAFWHRDALATAQYIVNWPAGSGLEQASLDWLHGYRTAMVPHAGDGAYVNYVDPTLENWPTAYFGGNYPRLQRVKAAYDPDNLFAFPQSVRLP